MMPRKGLQPVQVIREVVIASKLTWCDGLSRMFVHISWLSINLAGLVGSSLRSLEKNLGPKS